MRHDEGQQTNVKKVHRLWCEEGLQRRVTRRERAGVSSAPEVIADAPKEVWAIGFQFDSTVDGKAIKIASMVDEHTRESLLDLVERSITAERLVAELEMVFAATGGPPMVLRMDNGPELVFLKHCNGSARKRSACRTSRRAHHGTTVTSSMDGYGRSGLNRNHWNTLFEARVVTGDFEDDHNHRHRHSALGYRTPAEYTPTCSHDQYAMPCEIN